MDRLEITKAKELRNDIVSRLYTVYPDKVALVTLKNMLRYKSYNSENEIKKAVFYLSGKQYVTITENEDDYWDSMVQLAPMGINLAEGDITDLGVLTDE